MDAPYISKTRKRHKQRKKSSDYVKKNFGDVIKKLSKE